MKRYGQEPAKHLYDVEVKVYDTVQGGYIKERVEVLANTRTLAASILKREGYEVCSVNMVG